tara:strand:- start:123 stop:260 length:138 start_codon:yes stop_codon:yes gene_type:complete
MIENSLHAQKRKITSFFESFSGKSFSFLKQLKTYKLEQLLRNYIA